MRSVLLGAVRSTAVALDALHRARALPALLVTLPADHAARHSDYEDLHPTAAALGVPVLDATDVNTRDVVDAVAATSPEVVLVVGWSRLLGSRFLSLADIGTVGYHPSPLPEMRGRAVIPWTILTGRSTTGSTLLWLGEGVDDGDILDQVSGIEVGPRETAASLYDKHMTALSTMLDRTIPLLAGRAAPRRAQEHDRATWCARRRAEDGEIDWGCSADQVDRLVRAVGRPYPGAWTIRAGGPLRIWACEPLPPGPFIGLPGQVQAVDGDRAVVRCGDGRDLALLQVESERGPVAAGHLLRTHERLGRR
jgi:methionyl-tRNA formyltransferase